MFCMPYKNERNHWKHEFIKENHKFVWHKFELQENVNLQLAADAANKFSVTSTTQIKESDRCCLCKSKKDLSVFTWLNCSEIQAGLTNEQFRIEEIFKLGKSYNLLSEKIVCPNCSINLSLNLSSDFSSYDMLNYIIEDVSVDMTQEEVIYAFGKEKSTRDEYRENVYVALIIKMETFVDILIKTLIQKREIEEKGWWGYYLDRYIWGDDSKKAF